ncbi:MAG: hypothetical protein HYU28_12135 [Actinobacteria bacterium]|nr:hypothetical protein [Actinomycetota bacterium]
MSAPVGVAVTNVVNSIVGAASEATTRSVVVEIAGQVVLFETDDDGAVAIVETILAPYCRVDSVYGGAPVEAGWHVTSTACDALADIMTSLREQFAKAGVTPTPIRRWAGDATADRFDTWPFSVALHDDPFEGITIFEVPTRSVHYLRPGSESDVPHTEHVVKYPLRVSLREAGFAQVHAAGVVYRDRGLLLLGQRAAGKSTLAMRLMAAGASWVGNDLVYVRPAGDGCEMIAFPHMTRLAAGTIRDNDRVLDVLAAVPRTGDYLRSPIFNGGKEEFYFPVLARMWGDDIVCRQTTVDAIVIPSLDPDRATSEALPLRPTDARARVIESLRNDPPYPDWLPALTEDGFASLVEDVVAPIVECLPPAVELRFGGAASEPVVAIDGVLDRIG